MKVLVTGVGGFIGEAIGRSLAVCHEVSGVYRRREPSGEKWTSRPYIFRDNLVDPQALPMRCDYVVHAAAETPNTCPDEEYVWKSNVLGMRNLLDWTLRAGVRNFLFLSTMAVYGDDQFGQIDETTTVRAYDGYGGGKREAEILLENYAKTNPEVRCLTIRLPGVVGVGAANTFLPRIASDILNGHAVSVYKRDALFNNIVHVQDLAEFCSSWPSHKQSAGYTMFNVGAALPIPLGQVVTILMRELKRTVTIVEKKQGHPPFTISTEKALRHRFPVPCVESLLRRYALDLLN